MELEINKIKYPLFFNMTAIESVMQAAGMQDFSSFGENKDQYINQRFVIQNMKLELIRYGNGG